MLKELSHFTVLSLLKSPDYLVKSLVKGTTATGASQAALAVKNPPATAGDMRCGFDPWVGKIPWRRKWQYTPVFLPEKFHGQRSLAVYSLWGLKESDTTE